MEKITVDVYNGVYLDKSGNYFVIELGALKHKVTGEMVPGVKVIGINSKDEEKEMIAVIDSPDIVEIAQYVRNSEYLGEL